MQRGETVDLRELFSEASPDGSGDAGAAEGGRPLARIVRAATALQARRETLSAIGCQATRRCGGYLRLRLQDIPPVICWRCSSCRAKGSILNWPRTPWDLTLPGTACEPFGPRYEFPVDPTHYSSLLSLRNTDEDFQRIVFSAVPANGSILLRGDLPDFLYLLQRCIEWTGDPELCPQFDSLNRICQGLDSTIRDLESNGRPDDQLESDGALDLPAWLPPDLADRLRGALEEGHFRSIGELNDQLALTMEAYNRSPNSELAGLSPYQVSDLLVGEWGDGGVVRLNGELPAGRLEKSIYLHNARTLLESIREAGGARTTARGNLPRHWVREMIVRFSLEERYARDKALNEYDVMPVHITRLICQLAGLLRTSGRKFVVTRRAERLLAPERSGELFRRLFETFFRKFNLSYLDGTIENKALQDTVAFSLYALCQQKRSWHTARTLAPRILIPSAFENALNAGDDQPTWQAYTRLLLPLYYFGLLEFRVVKRKNADSRRQFRPSTLLRDFIYFQL